MKAYVEAYGCALNCGESREVEDLLASRGWELRDDPEGCDLVVISTCVVIEKTERAMLKRLRQLRGASSLVVTGCMATVRREKAEEVVPRAHFVPPGDLDAMAAFIEETCPVEGAGWAPARDSYAIVPLATGCLGECAYCMTRMARGTLRSREPSSIIENVRRQVSAGPTEVQLTGQDTAAYGLDRGTDLCSLVKSICSLPGEFRLRIGMMNPRSALPIVGQLAEVYLEPKVFTFLHLPVQSASDTLLGSMGRGYDVQSVRKIVGTLRAAVPELTLSTDIIVGYPGESEADHRANLELVEELQPDIVNVTRFSPRPGTEAADEPDRVVGWKAKQRSRELTEARFRVAHEKNKRLVGTRVRGLATERGKSGTTILRSDEYKQIVVPEELSLKTFYVVDIVGATPTYLRGKRPDMG